MNLSETAFLWPLDDAGRYRLRWMTPTMEVPICGHATLASARILFARHPHLAELRFETVKVGTLTARKVTGGDKIELDFPSVPPAAFAPSETDAVRQAFLAACSALDGPARIVTIERHTHGHIVEIELPPDTPLRSLAFDAAPLASVHGEMQCLTTRAPTDDPAHDFHSRLFAPSAGIAEDPVTGSLHCSLGPYWQRRLGKGTRDEPLRAFQASARGGELNVVVDGDRVLLRGDAIVVTEGTMRF
jgi:PhzF family phenazine biosynthesis protein